MSYVLSSSTTAVKPPEATTHQAEHRAEHQPRKYKAAVHSTTPRAPNGPTSTILYECMLCPGIKHPLYQCPMFNNMTINQRGDHLRNKRLCYNCLAPGHPTVDCRSIARCRACGGRHHTLVHKDQPQQYLLLPMYLHP